MIHWVLEYQPIGARGFVAQSQEEAERLCAAQVEYPASLRLTQIREGVVVLTMLKSDRSVRMTFGDLKRLVRELHLQKIAHLYYERQIGRLGPLAEQVASGPLTGMYYVDIAMVVAGSDGDY